MRSSRTAIARATAVTLIVWVSRLCTTPLVATDVTTCVTSDSRERAFANRIRSRSVRNSDSPGGYGRSGSGGDLASRGSMVRTLSNPATPSCSLYETYVHVGSVRSARCNGADGQAV